MRPPLLRNLEPSQAAGFDRRALDPGVLPRAAAIVDDVRRRGVPGLIDHAVELGDLDEGADWLHPPDALVAALDSLPRADRGLLERVAARIRTFARAQRACLRELDLAVPGGRAGHTLRPVACAGCYAPGGLFPLPSSVLMTAVVAREAGVDRVWIASPRPARVTLAACAVAGVEGLIAAGGAQAVAALAYGAGPVPACDVVVGPGNRWVTAAKHLVGDTARIDMLAGPSELLVLADASADPVLVASDLLAQAEHDPQALPMLITTDGRLPALVDTALHEQLAGLPTGEVARAALANGFCVQVSDLDSAAELCNRIAPEHLSLVVRDPSGLAPRLVNQGALFIGNGSAEVFGDYGAGPNHVLPTGGTARHSGGLSVFTFLKASTWLRIDDASAARGMAEDAAVMARLEGLEAHARAALHRNRLAPNGPALTS